MFSRRGPLPSQLCADNLSEPILAYAVTQTLPPGEWTTEQPSAIGWSIELEHPSDPPGRLHPWLDYRVPCLVQDAYSPS